MFAVGLGALLLVAGYVRLETLSQRPLWYDEDFTASFCREVASLPEAWGAVPGDESANPPLHYVAVYLVMQLADSPAAVRSISVISGLGTVVLVGLIGRTVLGAAAGWLAALLMTVSVYHINCSMDARPYSLMLFFITGQFLALIEYRQRRSAWLLLPFVLCATGAILTHHLALVAQLAVAVLALADLARLAFERRRRGRELKRAAVWYLAGGVATTLLYLPQIRTLVDYAGTGNLASGHYLDLSGRFAWHLAARWTVGDNWVTTLVLLAFCAGVVGIVARRDEAGWAARRERRLETVSARRSIAATVLRFDLAQPAVGLLVWLAVPFTPFALVPFAKFFDIRFVIVALPPFLLVSAAGLLHLGRWMGAGRRWLRVGVPLLLSVVIVSASVRSYAVFRKTDYRCGDFFAEPELLTRDGGFCRDQLILNTIYSGHGFLMRSARRPGSGH